MTRLLLISSLAGAVAASATAQAVDVTSDLRRHGATLTVEYQTLRVPGDQPIDLLGFHAYQRLAEGLYAGGGFYAPMVRGAYGGFVAADLGLHLRRPLAGPWVALAGVSAGGGGGGRSVEHSKQFSGSGGFVRAHAGLGYDFGGPTLGLTASRLKFRGALLDSTQANLILELPFRYLTGPFSRHGQALSPADDRRAAEEMGEAQFTLSLDNFHQRSPRGAFTGTLRVADLQYARYFTADQYWFASLAMGYSGLPLYNQVLGGVGQRWRWSPELTLYAQLGLGSGGYSSEKVDTGPGLLVAPRVAAEFALTPQLGLAVSAGTLSAPKGSFRNLSWGLSLTHHLRSRAAADAPGPASYQGLRLSVLHQTEHALRYRGIERPALHLIGLQLDVPVSPRAYVPLQASAAYNAYLGYPGYAEILGGLGVQTRLDAGERWQAFAQLLGGANVHGKTGKASLGLRYVLDERLALNASAGQLAARSASGGGFEARHLSVGLDYRFAVPVR